MNWDNIRIFLAVARHGSISQAGREVGLNHSTVLRRIDSLEDELGARLFIRRSRGYEITPVGERILDSAVMMDRDAAAVLRQVMAEDSQAQGRLQVAMPPGTCLNLMPEIMEFKKQNPLIDLELDSHSELHNLDLMEADVAIRLSHNPPEHYVAYHLFDMPFSVYGARSYLDSIGKIGRVGDADWICYSLPGNPSMEKWLREIDPEVSIIANVNTLALVKQGIDSGAGVSLLPVHTACETENFGRVTIEHMDYSVPVYLLAHRDMALQPRVKRFLDFIRIRLSGRSLVHLRAERDM